MSDAFRVGYTKDFLGPHGNVGWGDIGLAAYDGVLGLDFGFLPESEPVLTPTLAGDYDALGMLGGRATAELFDHAPRLAVVARFGVGYDSVDLDAATRNGIAVTISAPEGVRRPMAGAAMTLVVALSHRLLQKDRLTREGGWSRKVDYMGDGLIGKTLGVIGLGNIARDLFSLAAPWGMRHIAADPFVTAEQAAASGVALVDLETLLRGSDYVVVLCMLTPETHHLLNRERLSLMKPSAYLINVARGPIVDEVALHAALASGGLRGAGLDVFEQEPPDPANPLLALDNVIVAPHALGWTDQLATGIGGSVIESILDVRRGVAPKQIINRAVLDSPRFQEKLATYRDRWGST